MAYDELTVQRFRAALEHVTPIVEKRMMGGLCFMYHGHMIGGADKTQDGTQRFMFRIGKENHQQGMLMPFAQPMIQGGRTMRGLFFVGESCCDDEQLQQWISLAINNISTMPSRI